MADRRGGGLGGGVASRCRWGERRSGPHPVFFFFFFGSRVYKHTQQARKRGRVQARGGYKLPVIDARRRGGRQLKTRGAHR